MVDFPEAERSPLGARKWLLFTGVKPVASHETTLLGYGCEEDPCDVSLQDVGRLEREKQEWKTEIKQEMGTESLTSQSSRFQEFKIQEKPDEGKEKAGVWESKNGGESREVSLKGTEYIDGEVQMWEVEIKQETGRESFPFRHSNLQKIPIQEKEEEAKGNTCWDSKAEEEPQKMSLEEIGCVEEEYQWKTEIKEETGNVSRGHDFHEIPIQVKTGKGRERNELWRNKPKRKLHQFSLEGFKHVEREEDRWKTAAGKEIKKESSAAQEERRWAFWVPSKDLAVRTRSWDGRLRKIEK
uniref:Uncharacterized protein n=1 Tax=Sphaerodactylus townsendi TaxID=933632 RepID=A0ACB8EFD2_9SAUR